MRPIKRLRTRPITLLIAHAAIALAAVAPAAAQDRRDEQFYYPGAFNWQFLRRYPDAARLFNAFDYGHAVLYEILLTRRGPQGEQALEQAYQYLVGDLLVRPPRFAVAEEAIMPRYAKLAWRAKMTFDWAHVLHRQIYDVYADDRIPMAAKDSLIERITDYYLSKRDYAFVDAPKAMELMDGQAFSQAFRRAEPKFNGLIWAYHWLQVGLYEPLVVYGTEVERRRGVEATVARFRRMLANPPASMPEVMPMTAAVAPEFARRHPRAAAIFDNLHMMHDIVSDLLLADSLTADGKRGAIYAQLTEFRDSTRNVMPLEHWGMMGEMMGGVDRMGGTGIGPWPDPPNRTPGP
jgi:hypothetical protein